MLVVATAKLIYFTFLTNAEFEFPKIQKEGKTSFVNKNGLSYFGGFVLLKNQIVLCLVGIK